MPKLLLIPLVIEIVQIDVSDRERALSLCVEQTLLTSSRQRDRLISHRNVYNLHRNWHYNCVAGLPLPMHETKCGVDFQVWESRRHARW